MTDWLKKYGNKKVNKFQEGGAMPAPEAAPQGGGDDLQAMLLQAYETQDPNMALQVVNAIVESMGGGAGAPMPAGSKGMRMDYNTPVFKKGGKLKA